MKTFYRCTNCQEYTFQHKDCPLCHAKVMTPYPAKFSLVKEQRYRYLIRNAHHKEEA